MNTEPALAALIGEHLARRPAMHAQDVYKLLYQGVRGPEHLVTSAETFMARLRAEWEAAEANGAKPLTEAVRPDGALLRVNLRPLKARGGDPERVGAACLSAARYAWGLVTDLQAIWLTFIELCTSGAWPSFPLAEVWALTRWLTENAYPAVHHSERYWAAYRPAYRLVAADLIQMLIPRQVSGLLP